jgi:translocation and assembly module TamA
MAVALAIANLGTFLWAFAPAAAAAEEMAYEVAFIGLEGDVPSDDLKAVSRLLELRERPPSSLAGLRRRAEEDVERFREVLRANAFYAAEVSYAIDEVVGNKHRVVMTVNAGPQYKLKHVEIRAEPPSGAPDPVPQARAVLGLEPGMAGEAAAIVAAERRMLAAFAAHGYPYAKAERRVTVDHSDRRMTAVYTVATGPFGKFGATTISGLKDLNESYIRHLLEWQPGETFDIRKLEDTRKNLRDSGLFSVVTVTNAPAPAPDGTIPIEIRATERLKRTIGIGATASTSEGVGVKAFWRHRNLWGGGEQLGVTVEVGTVRQGGYVDLRLPNALGHRRDFVIESKALHQEPDGFESTEAGVTGRVEQKFSDVYTGSAGLGYEYSDVEDNRGRNIFNLVSLPLELRRDASNDLLDPTKGDRTTLALTPYQGVAGSNVQFVVGKVTESAYLPLTTDRGMVLAGWAQLGTIMGESTLGIPANKRLYAGGPGSVRAYGLNLAGPVDAENDPIGGRSLTAFGAEFRYRLTENIGLVPFVEAGTVYDSTMPEWGEDLLWGTGLGLRYFTPIGPIRFDLAFPINRRRTVDDPFQVLVSIGQAF